MYYIATTSTQRIRWGCSKCGAEEVETAEEAEDRSQRERKEFRRTGRLPRFSRGMKEYEHGAPIVVAAPDFG